VGPLLPSSGTPLGDVSRGRFAAGDVAMIIDGPWQLINLKNSVKFKIGLAWPGDNCVDIYSHDLGLVPVPGPDGAEGFAVLVGGGLGASHARPDDTFPRLADPLGWVPADGVEDLAEAVILAFRDLGNREDRKRARLKYVLEELGVDAFRREVEARFGAPLAPAPELPEWHQHDHLGWHRQDDGRWFLGLPVPSGRVAGSLRTALTEAVERYDLDLRVTPRQDVLLTVTTPTIVVRPMVSSPLDTPNNTIIGNTVLYGATAGKLFAAGQAGERFAVRNSGATVVVEGCGANGCEYMTGGTAVILGKVGENFGAGMTGGMAFVLDQDGSFAKHANPESIIWQRFGSAYWEARCKSLIAEHAVATGSGWANAVLDDWETWRDRIWQVCPKEMLSRLDRPLNDAEAEMVAAE